MMGSAFTQMNSHACWNGQLCWGRGVTPKARSIQWMIIIHLVVDFQLIRKQRQGSSLYRSKGETGRGS
jgi:hypothetical protein